MKAIGKGSLASILSVGLHFSRIIIWIAFAGLAIAMVAIPFAAIIFEYLQNFENVNVGADFDVDRGDYVEVAHHFVTFSVLLFIVNRLLEILKTLRLGSPFVSENADRFRTVGYALLIGEGAKFAFGILSKIFDADINVDIQLITWVAILAVFVLAEVFHEGARMKEEQDLTV